MNGKRIYRSSKNSPRLRSFTVKVKQTDLWIAVSKNCFEPGLPARVERFVYQQRLLLETYLAEFPHFARTLEPCLPEKTPPPLFQAMCSAGNKAGTGPMAAVAGAFAEAVGLFLLDSIPEVIVENGGDIFLKVINTVHVGFFTRESTLHGRLALKIDPGTTPLGVCTSSGTVGPSLSFGQADAAVVLSPSTALADAAATALGNRVNDKSDLETALEYVCSIEGVSGAVVIAGESVAACGNVELAGI